jgi:glutathionyl-hydroquinone reductase
MKAQFVKEQSDSGEFQRQEDAFREWISADGSTAYPAVNQRYHLYVSLACPWASRAIILRTLKGLEEAVGMTVVDPIRDERGWAFRNGPGYSEDPVNGFRFLSEAYQASDPKFDGRVTVPVLWDKETKRIVNNCEDDICLMLNTTFNAFARHPNLDLFPNDIHGEQEALSDFVYSQINNAVYQAGFATRQRAYEKACQGVFEALDQMDERLAKTRYLFGNRIVETDWRLFCTLIRFDPVYHGHFKCNLRRILDYRNLQGYLKDLYQQPGIAGTVNFDHIKRHYYVTHTEINPTGIVPLGPILDLDSAHGREQIGLRASRDL